MLAISEAEILLLSTHIPHGTHADIPSKILTGIEVHQRNSINDINFFQMYRMQFSPKSYLNFQFARVM